jgi:tetratricopeptide (TPR) repeat protein
VKSHTLKRCGLLRACLLGCGWLGISYSAEAAKSSARAVSSVATPALTLEELVHHCTRSFAAQDWRSAVAHGEALIRDYGDRAELNQLLPRIQLVLLQSNLRLQQWAEAAPLFEPVLRKLHAAPPEVKGELLVQKASCERHLEQYATARTSVTGALSLLPANSARRAEAVLLLAACILDCKAPEEAGRFLEQTLPSIPSHLTENALILGMQAFLRAEEPERAFALFCSGVTKSSASASRIGIQFLLLEVASASLEGGAAESALICLSRILPPEQLVSEQRKRLAVLRNLPATGRLQQGASAHSRDALQSEMAQLQGEIDSLGTGAVFFESTRLLIAAAYRGLNRLHEAALVLEDAVAQIPSSGALEAAWVELAKTWFELGRWQRVTDSVERFSKAFAASKHLSLMLYLRGCAEQKAGTFDKALPTFQALLKSGVADEFGINAAFMHALTLLLANRLPEAVQELNLFWQTHKTHPLADAAAYWLCEAKAQMGPPATLRALADEYLKCFPNGEYKPPVLLRRAQALNALDQKATAILDLENILGEHPDHACTGEASLLLGDCRLALGAVEDALAAWRAVPENQTAAREEGVLKCAKLLYRCERFTELKELLRASNFSRVDSPRLAEAAAWLWKACQREGHLEEAIQWTLERLEALGNDPSSAGVEALLSFASIRSGSASERALWREKADTLCAAAAADGRVTLCTRIHWANATCLRAQNADQASRSFIRAATLHPARLTGPAVLADGAAALETEGRPADAARLWRELLKWHPRAPQKDGALCALARFDLASQQTNQAWRWIERFEKSTSISPFRPGVLLVKAALQNGTGNAPDALKTLEQLLREKNATPAAKSEALFRMGEIHRAAGAMRTAISYLQRAYVSYGHCQPWAARAYIASAEAFRALGDKAAARNTYTEFLASDAPAASPERARAVSELVLLETKP